MPPAIMAGLGPAIHVFIVRVVVSAVEELRYWTAV
jgi:hypothetical protein